MTEFHSEGAPRAVRAWADYDEWSMLVNKEVIPVGYARYHWPKFGEGEPHGPYVCAGVVRAVQDVTIFGPLQSLRVLFDTGHEMEMRREKQVWCVRVEDALYFPSHSEYPTDTEAVTRALAEAGRWIGEQAAERRAGR